MLDREDSPGALAEAMGLVQVQDEDATSRWVDDAFAANAKAVADALNNPKKTEAAIGYLRGQVMKQSRGQADPKLVSAMIADRLEKMG